MTKILYPQALLFYNYDSFRLIHTQSIANNDHKMTFKFINFLLPPFSHIKYISERKLNNKTDTISNWSSVANQDTVFEVGMVVQDWRLTIAVLKQCVDNQIQVII